MSMYRCAACGSSHVVADTKKEGFSVGKGIAGTALFGSAGAVMGVNGKNQIYYHCADCGQTLSYAMPASQKERIDQYLGNPEMYGSLLEAMKNQYPNIEWNKENEVKGIEESADDEMTGTEAAEAIWNYYLKTKIPYVERNQLLDLVFGKSRDTVPTSSALRRLEKRGVLSMEYTDGQTFCSFSSDPEVIKENLKYENNREVAEKIYKEHYVELKEKFLNFIHAKEHFTSTEVTDDVVFEFLVEKNLSDNKEIATFVSRKLIVQARVNNVIATETLDNVVVYTALNEEQVAAAKASDKQKYEDKYVKPYKDAIIKALSNNERKTVAGLAETIDASCQRLSAVCRRMEQNGELEVTETRKKRYFSLPGVSAKLEQREAEEKRKQEEAEQVRKQELESKLDGLKKSLEGLKNELEAQQKIYNENVGKIFGAGAKAKREAKEQMVQIEGQIKSIESDMVQIKGQIKSVCSNKEDLKI